MNLFLRLPTLAVACASLLLTQAASGASFDAFLEIEGIAGETEDRAIPLNSFSFGASNSTTACEGGGGAAREASAPSVSEIVVTKITDASTPRLALACAMGKHFDKVTLRVLQTDDTGQATPYLVYKLENVLISSYSLGGSGGDRPMESLSLNYTKITFEYKPQSADGQKPPVATWDLCTNKK
jgi:type VI secretion system secreted protein Hcp